MKLHNQIFIAMILGAFFGYFLPELHPYYDPIGTLFIRLLKCLIVPLVLASLTVGVHSIGDIRQLGKLGSKTLGYFVATTAIAVTIGLVLANTIRPGVGFSGMAHTFSAPTAPQSLLDTLITIIPINPIAALSEGQMLSVIFIAIAMGLGLTQLKEKGAAIISFFKSLDALMMTLTDWVMKIAPIGVFALIASLMAKTGLAAIIPLSKFALTVVIGLAIHAFVIIPLILKLTTRVAPSALAKSISSGLATGFSTASSAAAMPIVMERLMSRMKISEKTTSFVVPLGTTINMNGTALYQGVATLFIAQFYGISLGLAQFPIIIITAVLAAVGAAAIPSAGLITLVIILNSVGVPIEGIAIILSIDRLLDMARTTTNIWGNAAAAAVLDTKKNTP